MYAPAPLRRQLSRSGLLLLGPAFVAAVAYVDPGNFATNIAAGAKYGYLLCWVVVGANLMAVLVQYLAAKASIATGRTLPQLCRDHFKRSTSTGLTGALVPARHWKSIRSQEGKSRVLRATRLDVAVAMALAGAVNLAMVVLAAAALKGTGADSLDAAHLAIGERLGHLPALLF